MQQIGKYLLTISSLFGFSSTIYTSEELSNTLRLSQNDIHTIGDFFYTRDVLLFIMVGFVLLAAMVGAIILALSANQILKT